MRHARFLCPSMLAAFAPLLLASACGDDSKSTQDDDASVSTAADSGSVEVHEIDRTGLADVGKDKLDYADPRFWLCRPGNEPNECLTNLDATDVKKDLTTEVVKHEVAKDPKFDCFYIYPTVALGGGDNTTNFEDIAPTLDPLVSQAAPFNSMCEIYAPLYRQNSLSTGGGSVAISGDSDLAYEDVVAAFDYYMKHDNHGRKFVLMGHSQGTFMLTRLIQERFDGDASEREQLISALLIGGAVTVAKDKLVGGTFKNIPACSKAGETGCVVAYNSYAKEAPPTSSALFGATTATTETLCSPLDVLAKNDGRLLGAYSPTKVNNILFKPDGESTIKIDTAFGLYRDFFRAKCVTMNERHYLEISVDKTADDMRPTPPYRSSTSESIGFGLHIVDYAIPFFDLLEVVRLQAATALK